MEILYSKEKALYQDLIVTTSLTNKENKMCM